MGDDDPLPGFKNLKRDGIHGTSDISCADLRNIFIRALNNNGKINAQLDFETDNVIISGGEFYVGIPCDDLDNALQAVRFAKGGT